VKKDGIVQGWYVCHLRRGGFCRVLQLVATSRGAEPVFDGLVYRARERGASGIYGRLEPQLFSAVSNRRSFIRVHEGRMLAHSHDRQIANAIFTGDALLTRMDGEWW
jgi:hypothetical protein